MFHIHRSLCHQFGRSIRIHQRRAGSTNSPDYEIVGRFADKSTSRYKAGQLFLHRVFAYRGIIVCSFDCKEFGRKDEAHFETTPYYQVLVHRGDWGTMRFSTDTTTYLTDHTSRDGSKQLSIIYGMDCVPHADVLPLSLLPPSGEFKPPIEHDLFKRLFQLADQQHPELGFNLVQELGRQRSWLSPQSTHIETTESIRVMITTYYLGTTSVNAHNAKHCWRYVVRLENLDDQSMLLRERHIKVFSLNNLTQASGGGVVGEVPRLTREYPAFQFSSVVDVNQRKGGHMWGKLKLEREDGSVFDVNLPTVLLETNGETGSNRVNENLVQ
ncbi:ApaG domain-containing protein [Aphelenchoides fujianensis]|nr:ApaG domain-containing protein [Aphelenchoides fujianensis]